MRDTSSFSVHNLRNEGLEIQTTLDEALHEVEQLGSFVDQMHLYKLMRSDDKVLEKRGEGGVESVDFVEELKKRVSVC